MFGLLRQCKAFTMLAEYSHPSDDGYIGADENWEYLNKFVQPCYSPTYSVESTEPCNFTSVKPTTNTGYGWTGTRSNVPDGKMLN
mmetsp:Transcript_65819/g.155963  ORF Transcript_65819/g.155963 Transcript_65819/m.155963 type:complete len:85 (+) Transcript_65819:53-307(+)